MANPNRSVRSINIDPKVWEEAKAKAEAEDTTMSKVIRNALEIYVKGVTR